MAIGSAWANGAWVEGAWAVGAWADSPVHLPIVAAVESEGAQTLSFEIHESITAATESDVATVVNYTVSAGDVVLSIVAAVESDIAQTIGYDTYLSITPAIESDVAQVLSFSLVDLTARNITSFNRASGSYVEIDTVTYSADFTLEFICATTSTQSFNMLFGGADVNDYINIENSGVILRIVTLPTLYLITVPNLADGLAHKVQLTRDGANLWSVIVDGTVADTFTKSGDFLISSIARHFTAGSEFTGEIFDVKTWANAAQTGSPEHLWALDEAGSGVVIDTGTLAANGTAVNTTGLVQNYTLDEAADPDRYESTTTAKFLELAYTANPVFTGAFSSTSLSGLSLDGNITQTGIFSSITSSQAAFVGALQVVTNGSFNGVSQSTTSFESKLIQKGAFNGSSLSSINFDGGAALSGLFNNVTLSTFNAAGKQINYGSFDSVSSTSLVTIGSLNVPEFGLFNSTTLSSFDATSKQIGYGFFAPVSSTTLILSGAYLGTSYGVFNSDTQSTTNLNGKLTQKSGYSSNTSSVINFDGRPVYQGSFDSVSSSALSANGALFTPLSGLFNSVTLSSFNITGKQVNKGALSMSTISDITFIIPDTHTIAPPRRIITVFSSNNRTTKVN